ncbi:uncharacterized protein LOC143301403 isoform X2 [Babylonia areolata]|uniref:uncharacterized protein LOC143301403 isoform X2 n=1 Tax=Babylonia areolata TaxID=304850 RepID=UPI003FCF66FA
MLLLLLLLFTADAEGSAREQLKNDVRQRCYSIGTCMPSSEPDGAAKEICSTFMDAVRCMETAVDACRLLGFPADTLSEAEGRIQELRQLLAVQCPSTSTTPAPTSSKPVRNVTASTAVTDRAHELTAAVVTELAYNVTADTGVSLSPSSGETTSAQNADAKKEASKDRHMNSGAVPARDYTLSTALLLLPLLFTLMSPLTTASACGL